MYGKLKGLGRETRIVNNPNKVKILAIFQDISSKRYIIEAAWDTATHPRLYIHRDNYKVIYYDKKLDDMETNFYWLVEGEIEPYEMLNNKAAKSLLMEEY